MSRGATPVPTHKKDVEGTQRRRTYSTGVLRSDGRDALKHPAPPSMVIPRLPLGLLGCAALALLYTACGRDARHEAPPHASDPARAAAVDQPTRRDSHRAACDSVAALWENMDGVKVTRSDSTFTPYSEEAPVRACRVAMVAPTGLPSDAAGKVYWADSTFRGWHAIPRWDADGPGAFGRIFVRAGVRCLIEYEDDPGDDSDSTYVPSPLVAEQTACWSDTLGVTARDTAMISRTRD